MEWGGVGWSGGGVGVEWGGVVEWGWSGVEWGGVVEWGWSGVEWGGVGWSGVEWGEADLACMTDCGTRLVSLYCSRAASTSLWAAWGREGTAQGEGRGRGGDDV